MIIFSFRRMEEAIDVMVVWCSVTYFSESEVMMAWG
jgi:hypothetical protein